MGTTRAKNNDHAGALAAFETAADILFRVRGNDGLSRAKDLWRIVGASLAVDGDGSTQALSLLCTIYKDHFEGSGNNRSRQKNMFRDLSLKYSLPWWKDELDERRAAVLEGLIVKVVRLASIS